jgi:DNA gyrase subunit A
LGIWFSLILSVSENGYGKRTDVDQHRLQSRSDKGVINKKAIPKVGEGSSVKLVDETSELMVISQFGKIIRISTPNPSVPPAAAPRASISSTSNPRDKVAAA